MKDLFVTPTLFANILLNQAHILDGLKMPPGNKLIQGIQCMCFLEKGMTFT